MGEQGLKRNSPSLVFVSKTYYVFWQKGSSFVDNIISAGH
jgi:hypothetical protein